MWQFLTITASAITEKPQKLYGRASKEMTVNAVCSATVALSTTGIATKYVTACSRSVFALCSVYSNAESNNTQYTLYSQEDFGRTGGKKCLGSDTLTVLRTG
jgi:hypothetical protein